MRYGRLTISPQSFSRPSTLRNSPRTNPQLGMGSRGRPLRLYTAIHKTACASFRCPCWVQRVAAGRECSPVVHRLRLWGLALGSASPCADCHGAGNLRLTVCGVLTRICAYSVRHPHFRSLHAKVSTGASSFPERSPTPRRQTSKAKLRRAA